MLANNFSQSTTNTSSTSHTSGTSVTRAIGPVTKNVQKAYDDTQKGYQESQTVTNARDNLKNTLNNKPGVFTSQYEDALTGLYDQIMNREDFKYNQNEDPLYRMYKERYEAAGESAMKNTMAQGAANTGGYANSAAQTGAQAQYNAVIKELQDMTPQLREMALDTYRRIGNELYDRADLTNTLYGNEYGEYRDSVSDWQSDRSFDADAYYDERNFDYGKFNDYRNWASQEYWNQRNAVKQTDYSSTTTGSSTSNTFTRSW